MKANLLSKDFWFAAKELKNQEGFDEVLALVNKDLLDSQHGVARFRSEFAASLKAVGTNMRGNTDWGFSQTDFTEFVLRLVAAPSGGSTWYGESQQRSLEITTICKDCAAAVIGRL